MTTNAFSVPSSIVEAPGDALYRYRVGMGMIPSAEWLVFFDDFVSPITTNVPFGWAAAIIDTGATVVADTTVGAGAATGAIYFDSDGTTEGASIYLPEVVQLVTGKKFFMETRVKVESPTDSDYFIGLNDLTATTDPEDMWDTSGSAFVACGVLDSSGTGNIEIVSDLANAGPVTTVGTKTLGTGWSIVGLGYDGSKLRGYVNGKLAVTHTGLVPVGVTLAPFISFRNGSAATSECQVDFFRYVMER